MQPGYRCRAASDQLVEEIMHQRLAAHADQLTTGQPMVRSNGGGKLLAAFGEAGPTAFVNQRLRQPSSVVNASPGKMD